MKGHTVHSVDRCPPSREPSSSLSLRESTSSPTWSSSSSLLSSRGGILGPSRQPCGAGDSSCLVACVVEQSVGLRARRAMWGTSTRRRTGVRWRYFATVPPEAGPHVLQYFKSLHREDWGNDPGFNHVLHSVHCDADGRDLIGALMKLSGGKKCCSPPGNTRCARCIWVLRCSTASESFLGCPLAVHLLGWSCSLWPTTDTISTQACEHPQRVTTRLRRAIGT